jgi:hypothetical protein
MHQSSDNYFIILFSLYFHVRLKILIRLLALVAALTYFATNEGCKTAIEGPQVSNKRPFETNE